MEAQKLSARAGYRMTCTELEIPEWDAVQQRDKLLGCSLTGWQDMVNALNLSVEDQEKLLRDLKESARKAAKEYSEELGQKEPLLITTIKPEGTLSLLPVVSSGVHFSHSPYFIRRIRISSDDPLTKVCEELGYPVFPEVGQDSETCTTKVVEFPVKVPDGRTKDDVSALEQLDIYKRFMTHYVEHNCSITVHVKDAEWEGVEEWVWNNWEDTVALSFLSFEDNFYELLPFEAITEKEYNKRVKEMKPFIPSLISKYEREEVVYDIGNDGCDAGVCPVR
jgi:ribonucleoside-diphosphate reductase alpha chain/ribonucleoside-triphosphate reductase